MMNEELQDKLFAIVNQFLGDPYRVAQLVAAPVGYSAPLVQVTLQVERDGAHVTLPWALALEKLERNKVAIALDPIDHPSQRVYAGGLDVRDYVKVHPAEALEAVREHAERWARSVSQAQGPELIGVAPLVALAMVLACALLGCSTIARTSMDGATDGDGAVVVDASWTADSDAGAIAPDAVSVDAVEAATPDVTDPVDVSAPPDALPADTDTACNVSAYLSCQTGCPCVDGSICLGGICSSHCTHADECFPAPTDPSGLPVAPVVCTPVAGSAFGVCHLACNVTTACPDGESCSNPTPGSMGVCQ